MVRTQHKVWEHFVRLEKVSKNQYFYVLCKYCENEGMDNPFEGRIRAMERHIQKCSAYINNNADSTDERCCSTVSASESSLKRLRSEKEQSVLSVKKLNSAKLHFS